MKKILLLLLLTNTICFAQYTPKNSFIRKALVLYNMGPDNLYYKSTNKMLEYVDHVVCNYAYDSKTHNLYVQTESSNCVITLDKDYAKIIKRNKDIPKLKGDDLISAISKVNANLDEKFTRLNAIHRKEIAEALAKVKADSLERVKNDSLRKVEMQNRANNYRKTHNWHWLPTNRISLICTNDNCDQITSEDSIYCDAIINDTIYHIEQVDDDLSTTYMRMHKYAIPTDLMLDEKFNYHREIFKDSLFNHKIMEIGSVDFFNGYCLLTHFEELQRLAPYGYIKEWSWDDEYSFLKFSFRYANNNKKTIKYIDVYFAVTNDVGDVCTTGHFKGTGPLGQFESASWNWDSSSYYVSGDASHMQLTKIILTYMNGTQKILSKKMIVIDQSQ